MTEDERAAIQKAFDSATHELARAVSTDMEDEETLYQRLKALHTAALGPYCTLIQIWETRRGLNPTQRRIDDAINLNELFGEKESTCGN